MRSSFLRMFGSRMAWGVAGLTLASSSTLMAQGSATTQSPAATAPESSQQVPVIPQVPVSQATLPRASVFVTLDEALEFARKNNPTLEANRTLVSQNKEQEVTANLRPNPVLSWDAQYLPIFQPSLFSSDYIDSTAQFDVGIGYLFERGQKRQHRLQAAKDVTAVTESQVLDMERTTVVNTAQQFVTALLAKSNLEFAAQFLQSYMHTVDISQEQHQAGAISKADLLKIQVQTLQFQADVTSARIALVQALGSLRQLMGFESVPRDYDVAGDLAHESLTVRVEDLEAKALKLRPDLQATQRSIVSANSQIGLAKANSKQDLDVTFDYSHVNTSNNGAFFFNIPLPIFNRNQGEVARNYWVLTQSQFQERAAEQQVLTDVRNAYEVLQNSEAVLQLYEQGYLQQAKQALEITLFSYQHGGTSLLDFLDAERSYRMTELSYRQALASHMSALEQLRQAVGTRDLR
jgi:cobalt-zinc-cadmium efflux system outer membrane protein